jgi:serine/threonine protein kinase
MNDPTASLPLPLPSTIGPYTPVELLGYGGSGSVYKATDARGRTVAVKVLHEQFALDPQARVRIGREMELAQRVRGISTVAVIDADTRAPRPWLAMEYIEGPTLTQVAGELSAEELRRLGAALLEALRALHAQGVVHRDLKPSNVLLSAVGPKVIDFGIAIDGEQTRLTSSGMTVGTPAFMAPEQLEGGPIGTAADVWAWGAVMAEVSSGVSPFGHGTALRVMKSVLEEPPGLEGVPNWLQPICGSCLQKDPAARPSIDELIAALYPTGEAAALEEVVATTPLLPPPDLTPLRHPLPKPSAPAGATPPATAPASPTGAPPPPPPGRGEGRPAPLAPGDRLRTRILGGVVVLGLVALAVVAVLNNNSDPDSTQGAGSENTSTPADTGSPAPTVALENTVPATTVAGAETDVVTTNGAGATTVAEADLSPRVPGPSLVPADLGRPVQEVFNSDRWSMRLWPWPLGAADTGTYVAVVALVDDQSCAEPAPPACEVVSIPARFIDLTVDSALVGLGPNPFDDDEAPTTRSHTETTDADGYAYFRIVCAPGAESTRITAQGDGTIITSLSC